MKFFFFCLRLLFVFNYSLINEEMESFELYKNEFSKNFSKLNKQMEENKIKLEKVDGTNGVQPYCKNKENCSNMVSTRIIDKAA